MNTEHGGKGTDRRKQCTWIKTGTSVTCLQRMSNVGPSSNPSCWVRRSV